MAADYVVKLTGQDNLSETINNVKRSLTEVGRETSHLDTIREKFEKIQNSSAPLKRQLRDLKALMSQMNLDGLSHTEVFEEMAMYAGEVKDAMADANDAISRFADDNFKLAAMSEGFGLITGAVSTATFQFHNGTIKTAEGGIIEGASHSFQFQYGTIKTDRHL